MFCLSGIHVCLVFYTIKAPCEAEWSTGEHLHGIETLVSRVQQNSTLISPVNFPECCQNGSEFDSAQRTHVHLSGSEFKETIRKVWCVEDRISRGEAGRCSRRSEIRTDFLNYGFRTHFCSGLDQWSLCVCLDLRSEIWTELFLQETYVMHPGKTVKQGEVFSGLVISLVHINETGYWCYTWTSGLSFGLVSCMCPTFYRFVQKLIYTTE